jgi:hypothetical protein
MNMKFAFLACGLFCTASAWSQSKVFKEVNAEISSQMKIITQDEALIGYLVFSQLEKANKDSFNYQVSIMDENLSDIGKLNFREKNLELQAVSFDQDILCLVYLKSDISDLKSLNMKGIRKSLEESKNAVFTQLVNLQGTIIHTGAQQVELTMKEGLSLTRSTPSSIIAGRLKHAVILKNIPGKGFALFYGDDTKTRLSAMDITGKELWQKSIPEAKDYGMLTSATDVYLLSKKKHEMLEGGFDLRGYSAGDGTAYDRLELKDKKGNQLKVLGFELDPVTGKPVVTGTIINERRGNLYNSVKGLHKGVYEGVFSISMNGPKKADIRERYSYWKDGSNAPAIKTNGMLSEEKLYPRYTSTMRDYQGNTYFVGSSYERKLRVGGIVASVITVPLFMPPILFMNGGTHKSRQADVVVLRQDSAGKVGFENTIDARNSRYLPSRAEFFNYGNRQFYTVSNSTSRSNFLIMDEPESAAIYHVEKRKVVRRVPHKDGHLKTYIYPAKEGHIMVMEYNSKARETKLSIEAL